MRGTNPPTEDTMSQDRQNEEINPKDFDPRGHIEDMRDKWLLLLDDLNAIPGVVQTTLSQGGSRKSWAGIEKGTEYIMMAWPAESTLRSAVVVAGPEEGKLEPRAVFPFLEGIPNMLQIEAVHGWQDGVQGEAGVLPSEDSPLIWFYDPLFFRDRNVDLTFGVTQSFVLAGLCYGIQRTLIDEITLTDGPRYEEYAAGWLAEHPGKKSHEVPPLKIDMRGKRILGGTQYSSMYQARTTIEDEPVSFMFGPEGAQVKIYRFPVVFGEKNPIAIMIYAPEKACKNGYVPEKGHDVEMLFWLQGRITDYEDVTFGNAPEAPVQ